MGKGTCTPPPPGVQRPHHQKQTAQKLTPRPRVTPRLLTGLTGRRRVGESSRGGTGSSSSRRSHEAAARKTPTGMWPERPIQPHEGPTCWSRCEGRCFIQAPCKPRCRSIDKRTRSSCQEWTWGEVFLSIHNFAQRF